MESINFSVITSVGEIVLSYNPEDVQAANVDNGIVFKYRINVKCGDLETRFKFFGSIADYSRGHYMQPKQLRFALHCFVSDAIYGEYGLDQFQYELGYTSAKKCLKAWKGCKKSLKKCESMGWHVQDLHDLVDELLES